MAAAPLSLTYTPPAAPLPSWLSYTSAPTLTTTAFYTLPTLLSGSPSLLTASVVLTQWGTEIIQLPLTVEAPSGIVLGFPYTEVGGEGPTVVRVLGETGVFTLGDSGVRLFGSAEVVETGAVGTVGATGTGVEAGVSVTETSGATTLASGSGGTGVALTSAAATAGTMSGSSAQQSQPTSAAAGATLSPSLTSSDSRSPSSSTSASTPYPNPTSSSDNSSSSNLSSGQIAGTVIGTLLFLLLLALLSIYLLRRRRKARCAAREAGWRAQNRKTSSSFGSTGQRGGIWGIGGLFGREKGGEEEREELKGEMQEGDDRVLEIRNPGRASEGEGLLEASEEEGEYEYVPSKRGWAAAAGATGILAAIREEWRSDAASSTGRTGDSAEENGKEPKRIKFPVVTEMGWMGGREIANEGTGGTTTTSSSGGTGTTGSGSGSAGRSEESRRAGVDSSSMDNLFFAKPRWHGSSTTASLPNRNSFPSFPIFSEAPFTCYSGDPPLQPSTSQTVMPPSPPRTPSKARAADLPRTPPRSMQQSGSSSTIMKHKSSLSLSGVLAGLGFGAAKRDGAGEEEKAGKDHFTTSPAKTPRRKPSPPLEPTSPSIYSPTPLLFARPVSPALTTSSHEVDADEGDVFGDDKAVPERETSPERERAVSGYRLEKGMTASSFGTLGQRVPRSNSPSDGTRSSRSDAASVAHPSHSGSSSHSHSLRSASSLGQSLSPRSFGHGRMRTDSTDEGFRSQRRDTTGRGGAASSEGSSGRRSGRAGNSSDSGRGGGSSGSSRGHVGWVSAEEEVPPVPEKSLLRNLGQ